MSAAGFYRYVTHDRVAAYAALGWGLVARAPGHHGVYAVIMRWEGAGDPLEPAP